jgi:hypothetical protein
MNSERFRQLLETVKQQPQRRFEATVEGLEEICRHYAPQSDSPFEPRSDAWYADETLAAISSMRHQIGQGNALFAAYEALSVGVLAGHWPRARQLLKMAECGRSTAKARRENREKRDRSIAAFALAAARESDELAENPKQLARYVLAHWRAGWKEPLKLSTLTRILKEQKVASALRSR